MKGRAIARVALWTAGGCLLVVIAATASFCAALRFERRTSVVTVPDWTGKARVAAADEAQALGLGFEVQEARHDPGVASDRVVQQEPSPGAIVRPGRTVRVVVSLGGETITVPDIVSHPARQAEAEILRAGLTLGFETRIHDVDVPEGTVIAQSPPGGTLSVGGERVGRLVSDGPRLPRWVMPDLTGRPLRDVQDWITLCGFRTGPVRRVATRGAASDTVIGQLPPAGAPIVKRDVVELTAAR